MNKINISNVDYYIRVSEYPDDYMKEHDLSAYCNYNDREIFLSQRFIDGDKKSKVTLDNDLMHEVIHAYLLEAGLNTINNELTVNTITAILLNQNFTTLVDKETQGILKDMEE